MVIEFENTLRHLIINMIGESDSTDYKVSKERIVKWKEKREIEAKKNRGVLIENRIIFYSDFYDLRTIINKNWSIFLPILLNKKRFDIFFTEIENCRNTVSHGRNLILSQELLCKGILKDLKNLITIYHNKNEMKEDYFIEITQISDNLGNVWNSNFNNKKPVLRVGDEYEIIIEANDPKDRKIKYDIFTLGQKSNLSIVQDMNKFNLIITKNLVGKSVTLWIRAKTPNSEYENSVIKSIQLVILPE